MKTLATLCGLLWVSALLFAQAPESFKYQAVLRDAAGNIKANTPASIQLSILQGTVSGTTVYSETHGVTTNEFGLVNLTVGNGSSKVGNMAAIDWSNNSYFLKVTIDGADFGTSQLLSVPYALYAKNAANGFSGNYNDLTNKPTYTSPLVLNAGAVAISNDGITATHIAASAITNTEIADRTITPAKLANATTVGQILKYTAANTWTWAADDNSIYTAGTGLSLAGNTFSLSAPVSVANGGTGAATLTGVLIGNGTGALTGVTHSGANQYLRRNSANTAYEFGNLSTVATSGNYNDLLNRPVILDNLNYKTAVGFQALLNNGATTYYNTAVGYQSLKTNTLGYGNTAVGYQALINSTTGDDNTAIGMYTLRDNTTGTFNTATGYDALLRNTEGGWNTAFGGEALLYNTIGGTNTGLGGGALGTNTTGNGNTAIGFRALSGSSVSSAGDNNVAIGKDASYGSFSGSNNITIGYLAVPLSSTVSNQITLGNGSITSLRCAVQSISSLSDRRDKRDIQDLSVGLDFLMQLKPRQFYWDKREWYEGNYSDGSLMQSIPTAGFIAQELDETQQKANAEWLNLVLKDNPEKLEATYGNLLPVMIKAIQEQQKLIEELKRENAQLRSDINSRIQKLEAMLNSEVKVKQE